MKFKLQFMPNDKEAAKFEISRNENRLLNLNDDEKKDAMDFLETAEKVFKVWKENVILNMNTNV